MTTHEFERMRQEADAISQLSVMDKFYRYWFGDRIITWYNTSDTESQKLGVDRIVLLEGGKRCYVEEKIRPPRRDGREYDDIALEYLSSKEHGTPGWVCKPLKADYLLYINMPKETAYLLPVILLQKAWALNRERWMKQSKAANNGHYTTLFSPVKPDDLFGAMEQAAEHFNPVTVKLFKDIRHAMVYQYELSATEKLEMLSIKRECLVTV